MQPSLMLDVKLQNLPDSKRIIESGSRLHLYHGAAVRLAKAVLLDRDALRPGESCYAQLRLSEAFAARQGDRFVVRFYSPLETVGGGVILDEHPYRHKRYDARVIAALAVRESGSDEAKLVQAVGERGADGMTLADLAACFDEPKKNWWKCSPCSVHGESSSRSRRRAILHRRRWTGCGQTVRRC